MIVTFPVGTELDSSKLEWIRPHNGVSSKLALVSPGNEEKYTKLLVHGDTDAGELSFYDSSHTRNELRGFNGISRDAANQIVGLPSIAFAGVTGDHLKTLEGFTLSNIFTIDILVYPSIANICFVKAVSNQNWSSAITDDFLFGIDGNRKPVFSIKNKFDLRADIGDVLPLDTWSQLAIEGDGNLLRLYSGGNVIKSTSMAAILSLGNGNPINIGENQIGLILNMKGNLAEIRISNGIARYAGASYIPITSPYGGAYPTDSPSPPTIFSALGLGTVYLSQFKYISNVGPRDGGSFKHKLYVNDEALPAWGTDTFKTEAEIIATGLEIEITDTVNSIKGVAQLNSDGTERPVGDSIYSVGFLCAAAPDYPVEAEVLFGVNYDYGNLVGTLKTFQVDTNPDDTKQQRILDVVAARLKTILVANGYKTDAGLNVFGGRRHALEDSEKPGITWDADNEVVLEEYASATAYTVAVNIKVFADKGDETINDVRTLAADVVRCIFADTQMSGLADTTRLPDRLGEVDQAEQKDGSASIIFLIEYTNYERGNPYS